MPVDIQKPWSTVKITSGNFRWLLMIGLVNLALCIAGCRDGRPTVVPVSGRVLLDGQPLPSGAIRLIPVEGRAACGRIDRDGHFRLTTYDEGDGCLRGTHTVTVIAMNGPADEFSGGTVEWLAPLEFADPKTSPLTVSVAGATESLLIELHSGGR